MDHDGLEKLTTGPAPMTRIIRISSLARSNRTVSTQSVLAFGVLDPLLLSLIYRLHFVMLNSLASNFIHHDAMVMGLEFHLFPSSRDAHQIRWMFKYRSCFLKKKNQCLLCVGAMPYGRQNPIGSATHPCSRCPDIVF